MIDGEIHSLPLHDAVKRNAVDEIKRILSKRESTGIDVNAEDENGCTALIEACISGNEEIVNLLLQQGCPAQPSAGFRHSPIRGASVAGNSHIIPILLRNGADPNALSDGNRTALMGACFLRKNVKDAESKSVKCVEALLLDKRTDPTIANSFGETALDLAKVRGYDRSVELLQRALVEWNEGSRQQV